MFRQDQTILPSRPDQTMFGMYEDSLTFQTEQSLLKPSLKDPSITTYGCLVSPASRCHDSEYSMSAKNRPVRLAFDQVTVMHCKAQTQPRKLSCCLQLNISSSRISSSLPSDLVEKKSQAPAKGKGTGPWLWPWLWPCASAS